MKWKLWVRVINTQTKDKPKLKLTREESLGLTRPPAVGPLGLDAVVLFGSPYGDSGALEDPGAVPLPKGET